MATEQSLPEQIVKEAVGAGLDSSMRESILEAVEDAEGPRRRLSMPITAGAFGLGTAIGYVLGSQESVPIEAESESLTIEESTETTTSDGEDETDEENGGSRLAKLAVLLAVGGAIAYLRSRRRREEGWEPIDEFDQSLDEGASAVVEGLTEEEASDEAEAESAETADESATEEPDGDAEGAESDEESQD